MPELTNIKEEFRNKICRRPPGALPDRPVHAGRTNRHHSNHDTESECSQRGRKDTAQGATRQDRRKHSQAHREAGEQKEKAGAAKQEDYNTSRRYDQYITRPRRNPRPKPYSAPRPSQSALTQPAAQTPATQVPTAQTPAHVDEPDNRPPPAAA